jgi:hypothetical protein
MNPRIFLALMFAALVLVCNVHIAEADYKNRLTVRPATNPIDWPYSIDLGQLVQNSLIQAFADEANFHLVPVSAKKYKPAKQVSGKKKSSAKKYRGLMHPVKFDVVSRLIHVELDQAPPPAQRILIPGGYRQTAKLILDVDLVAHHTGRSIAHKRIQSSSRLGSLVVNLNQLPEDFDYDQLHRTSLGFSLDSISQKIMNFINHHLYSRPLEGETLMVDSHKKEAIISLGKVHGVKMGDLFDVYGVTLKFKDPFSQTDLGDKYDRRGVLRIKDVQEKFSVGEIVAGQELWEGDLARSRKYNPLPLEEATSASANQ